MKNLSILQAFAFLMLSLTLNSCTVVEGIFKTGMGIGAVVVVAIVAIIGIIIFKMRGGNKGNSTP